MTDNRFSSGTPNGGEDRLEYFAGPGRAAASPFGAGQASAAAGPDGGQFGSSGAATSFGSYPGEAADPFGAPPASTDPFGAPPASTDPFGAPPASNDPFGAPVFTAPPSRGGFRIGRVVAAALVLVLAGSGWDLYQKWASTRALQLPTTLGALPVDSSSAVQGTAAQIRTQLEKKNPGITQTVQAYGDSTRVYFAGAAREGTDMSTEMSQLGTGFGAHQQVGASTCASSVAGGETVCVRTDGHLSVVVAAAFDRGIPTTELVAGLVDEIWQQV